MKDILTPEQRETVERIRGVIKGWGDRGTSHQLLYNSRDLLSILDSLKPPEPKQYTEDELRIEFEKDILMPQDRQRHPHDKDNYVSQMLTNYWQGWLLCAERTGVLKE